MNPGDVRESFVDRHGESIKIRALRRADLDALTRFANAISKEKAVNGDLGVVSFDGRVTRKRERAFLDRTSREARRGNVASFAALSGGEMVGISDVWRRTARDVRPTGGFGIVIREGFRDRGIGERLTTEVLRESKALGIWLVELTGFATNSRAVRLYEKMGFRRVGVIPDKIVREERRFDEIVMYADLRNR